MKKSRVWQAIVPGTQNKPQDTLQIRKAPWHGVTKQPPAVPLPGPNVTPEPNEKIIRVWQAIVPGTQNKPQDTLQIRKTPWHGVTKQPPALSRMKKSRVWQAIVPGTQTKPQDTLQIRKAPWHGVTKQLLPSLCPGQTSLLNRMKKSRVWQAIIPGTQNRPQDILQIRKTPWHGATKQPPALNRMKKSRVWQAIVPGTQNKPQDTLQIRKTPWHGVTKQPPAVPLPGPNVTPEPNEKIKGLAGNCSRHTKQATRHPSNQENTLARRDETASCRPSARAKRQS